MSQPPAYKQLEGAPPDARAAEDPILLSLEETKVFSAEDHSQPLYELSGSLSDITQSVFTVQKLKSSSSPDVEPHATPIYSFKMSEIDGKQGRNLIIEGKSNKQNIPRTYDQAAIAPSLGGWYSCIVGDHFKAEFGKQGMLQFGNHLAWSDLKSNLLAVEMLTLRNKDGSMAKPPRLELQTSMDDKDMDLLVACWLARSWKQAQVDAGQNTKGSKIKRFLGVKEKDVGRQLRMDIVQNTLGGHGMRPGFGAGSLG